MAVPYDDRDPPDDACYPPVTYEAREASEQANRVDPVVEPSVVAAVCLY